MKVLQQLAEKLFENVDEEDNNVPVPNIDYYKSCNKINFHTWYSTMFASLAQHMLKTVIDKIHDVMLKIYSANVCSK